MKPKVNYEVITTADQSPTLRFKSSTAEESMHSHRGAFNETIYIYGQALDFSTQLKNVNILSVGLGLGYNEILSICHALKSNKLSNFYLESYEKDEFLIQQFKLWLNDSASVMSPIYNQILLLFAGHFNIDKNTIKNSTLSLLKNNQLFLKKSIGFTTHFHRQFNIVLFDAYCGKTSPELWQTDFLSYIIENMSKTKSCFSTYACKSILNKVLRENGFCIHKKTGFAGKRESTLATKGLSL